MTRSDSQRMSVHGCEIEHNQELCGTGVLMDINATLRRVEGAMDAFISLVNHVKFNVRNGPPKRCNTTPAEHCGRMLRPRIRTVFLEQIANFTVRGSAVLHSQALTDGGFANLRTMGCKGFRLLIAFVC